MASVEDEKLEVVDENQQVLEVKPRGEIHRKGLLHRQIYVWFYNSKGEILFQKRGEDRDIFPGYLDGSVGGHIKPGEEPIETALRETKEETGVRIEKDDLIPLGTVQVNEHDEKTGNTSNVFRIMYGHQHEGNAENLQPQERDEVKGFEWWPTESLLAIKEEERKQFVPYLFKGEFKKIYRKIKKRAV